MFPDEENLAKVVKFDEGPISAIGLKLQVMRPQAGERPGDMVIYTRTSALDDRMRLKLDGPIFQPSPYGIYAISGNSWDAEKSRSIPLEYDIRPERQLRKIVNRLEQDGLITPEQREKAYSELGIGEDLHKKPMNEGRVF
jgi:hypothetical protein